MVYHIISWVLCHVLKHQPKESAQSVSKTVIMGHDTMTP